MRLRSRGFTLVEIMIVVAIIGLLIAIALPNFMEARKKSQKRACQSNLRQVDGALQQMLIEETDANLIATFCGSTSSASIPDSYLKEPGRIQCPVLKQGYPITNFAVQCQGAVNSDPNCAGHSLDL